MIQLRKISKQVLLLAFLLVLSAGYAAAGTLTLVNGPIASATNATRSITSVVFGNANFLNLGGPNQYLELITDPFGQAGVATVVDTLGGTTTYNLFLHPNHTTFLRDYEFIPASISFPNVFVQNGGADPVIVFFTDTPGTVSGTFLTVEITNSWLDLNTMMWSIPGEGTGSGGPPVCTGVCPATWKFVDDGNEVDKNASQMDLQLVASVPEPSSLYLMAIGLGLGAQFIRRTRQSR